MEGLKTNQAEWDRAIALCEIIDEERPYGMPGLEEVHEGLRAMTSETTSDAYDEFHELLYSLGVVSPANLRNGDYLIEEKPDLDALTSEELAQLITAICRGDKFVDGLLTHYINEGLVTSAFRRLRDLQVRGEYL